ncbi:restriction endonuclease subunit S [Prevotella melaninogenica]|uniref:restriction endonuclease subunit S n=1 Tax=Prevotella melaninogenica TaxID=28132 RepID=UPI00242CF9C4|nr:restriction endonuclease subunit S [Prevotella melaninogenica]
MREGWELKKIGECFSYIKNGANIKQTKGAEGYPITRIETLSGGVFNRDRLGYADVVDLEQYKDYILESGDLLVSHINSKTYIGRTVVYEGKQGENIIHGMNLLRLKHNRSLINSAFLCYYTQSVSFKLDIMRIRKDAVNQSSFAISDFKKIRIPVPVLATQLSIVSELDKLNELIQIKKEQLKDYDALAQSIFYEMFGDPVENEKGWEVKTFGDCFSIGAGGTPSTKVKEYWDNGTIPWIGSNMCQNCIITETDGKFITEEGLNHSSTKLLSPGTVLVALVGATIGKVGLLRIETCTNQNVAFIKVQEAETFTSEFVYYHLMGLYGEFMKIGKGNFKMANQGFIKLLPISCPPLSLQQSFAHKIEQIERQKAEVQKTITDLETLLAARMQYWFD